MIVGIGIDSVEIKRFEYWHLYSYKSLSRIFQPHEIEYCLSNKKKSPERFAVRYAAKEAFLKAIYTVNNAQKPLNLAIICKNVAVSHRPSGMPELTINWQALIDSLIIPTAPSTTHLSLTHCATVAIAQVIIEKDQ